ncbi:hypothetical protein BDY21DRAFT_373094 [Lineolata rhizophorae]|uniref:C2H2-type domain-containing protein n=1 Tax=Lineolata rhizophorae TaxID=578093 RepID=A0A6A6NV36_9PEZI|nr:hypothetical protein BDY21DRAFT_373094 [Lineolata rhizophorae]
MPRIVDRKREKKFQCTYCQTDCLKFGDWKRHESERHNPKYFWTCPSVGCNARFAIDWRFAQHHKTKHNCVECKCAYQPSVRRRVEPAVEFWGCGFCLAEESLFDNWDARCGHVGRHFEHEGKTRQDWNNSLAVLNLLRRPDVRPFWIGKLHSVGYLEGMEFSPQLFRWAERHVDPLRQTLERTIDGNNISIVSSRKRWLQ